MAQSTKLDFTKLIIKNHLQNFVAQSNVGKYTDTL